MEQTLKEYIEAPAGKGNNSIGQKILRQNMEERYKKIESKIKMDSYKVKSDMFYLHFLIPSETERENTYDVVLQVYGDSSKKHIKEWYFKLFSNSPGFCYTFAYAFNLYDMMIPQLKGKIPKTFLTQAPYTRNPHEVVGYEKSIFFAVNYVLNNQCSTLSWLNANSTMYFKPKFVAGIRTFDRIMYEVNLANKKLKEKKKKEKAAILKGEAKVKSDHNRKKLRMTAKGIGMIDGSFTPKKEKIQPSTSTIKDSSKRGVRVIGKKSKRR